MFKRTGLTHITPFSCRKSGVLGRSDMAVPGREGSVLAFCATLESIAFALFSRAFTIAWGGEKPRDVTLQQHPGPGRGVGALGHSSCEMRVHGTQASAQCFRAGPFCQLPQPFPTSSDLCMLALFGLRSSPAFSADPLGVHCSWCHIFMWVVFGVG